MTLLWRRTHSKANQRVLLVVALLLLPWAAAAERAVSQGFPLRNQNPFLQIFGLPPFESATLPARGTLDYDLSLDLANHADAGDNAVEDFVADGETYFLTLSLRRGISDRLEFGLDLPLVAHQEGFLDNTIENWHDTFGMSNTKRRGPSNQLLFSYVATGGDSFDLGSPTFGLGDIRLSAALSLRKAADADSLSVAIRSGIKLPTGDAAELHGSGAADISLGVYASDSYMLWQRKLGLAAFAGALLLGDGDVLSGMQREVVPFGGIAATWHPAGNFTITTQLYAQGAYFRSQLKELGGDSLQLAVGGAYRLRARELSLRFAVVEDVSANATTDFALHFSLHATGGR